MNEELIEKVARAICKGLGRDPDQLVRTTGYRNAETIPAWQTQTEWAIRHIAAHEVLNGGAA